MKICVKLAKFAGMVLGTIAAVLVLLGVIGYILWYFNGSAFLNVANFWNYLYASIPFTLLAICCSVFIIAAGKKE